MSKNMLNFKKSFEIAFGESIDIIRATDIYFCCDFLNTPYRLVVVKEQSGVFEIRLLKFDFASNGQFFAIGAINEVSLTLRKIEQFVINSVVIDEKSSLMTWFFNLELSISTQVDKLVEETKKFNLELEIAPISTYFSQLINSLLKNLDYCAFSDFLVGDRAIGFYSELDLENHYLKISSNLDLSVKIKISPSFYEKNQFIAEFYGYDVERKCIDYNMLLDIDLGNTEKLYLELINFCANLHKKEINDLKKETKSYATNRLCVLNAKQIRKFRAIPSQESYYTNLQGNHPYVFIGKFYAPSKNMAKRINRLA